MNGLLLRRGGLCRDGFIAVLLGFRRLFSRAGTVRSGGRAMIGGVETRALEDDPHGLKHFAQGLLAALRAARQGRISERLVPVELHTAVIAPVGVNRHS